MKNYFKSLTSAVAGFFNDAFNKGNPAENPAGKGTENEARPRRRLVDGVDADKFTTLCCVVIIGFVSIVGAVLIAVGINSAAHEIGGVSEDEGSGSIIFTFGGSVIPNDDVIASAASDGQYNFNNCLSELSELMTGDISVIGLNGQINIHGENEDIKGYGSGSNYPAELASSFKDIGVDYIFGSNTSTFANGAEGIKNTAKCLKDNSVGVIGVADGDTENLNRSVVKVNGINVGMAGYNSVSYAAYEKQSDEDKACTVQLPTDPSQAASMISKDVTAMKKSGADFIVVFINWGGADEKAPSEFIKETSKLVAKLGVDVIVGSGPCITMDCEIIEYTTPEGGNGECYAFYSLGCLFGDMTVRDGYTNAMSGSMVVSLRAVRDRDGAVYVKSAEYQPVYVLKNILTSGDSERIQYMSIPMMKYVAEEQRPELFPDNAQWSSCKSAFSYISAVADRSGEMLVLGDIFSDDDDYTPNGKI